MLKAVLLLILLLLVIYSVKNYSRIKLIFSRFYNYILTQKGNILYDLYRFILDYKLKSNDNSIFNKKNFKDKFIFFQFGPKKHSYFKSWFNNLKKKKY